MRRKVGSKRVLTNKQQESRDAKSLIDEISRTLSRIVDNGFTRTHIRNILIWWFVLGNCKKRYTSELPVDVVYKALCKEINSLFGIDIIEDSRHANKIVNDMIHIIKREDKEWVFRLDDIRVERLTNWIYSQIPLESRRITKIEIENAVKELMEKEDLFTTGDRQAEKEKKIRDGIFSLLKCDNTFFTIHPIQIAVEEVQETKKIEPDSQLITAFKNDNIGYFMTIINNIKGVVTVTRKQMEAAIGEVKSKLDLFKNTNSVHEKEKKIITGIFQFLSIDLERIKSIKFSKESEVKVVKRVDEVETQIVRAFRKNDFEFLTNYFWGKLREEKREKDYDKSFTKEFVDRFMNCAYTYDVLLHARNKLSLFQDEDLLNDPNFIYKKFVYEFAELYVLLYQYDIDIHELKSIEEKRESIEKMGDDFIKYDLPTLIVLEAEHKQLGEVLRMLPAGKSGEKIKKQINTMYKRIGVLKDKQTVVIQHFAKLKYFHTLVPRLKDSIKKHKIKCSQIMRHIQLLHQITGGYFHYNKNSTISNYTPNILEKNYKQAKETTMEMLSLLNELYQDNTNTFINDIYIHPNIIIQSIEIANSSIKVYNEKRLNYMSIANAVSTNMFEKARKEYFKMIAPKMIQYKIKKQRPPTPMITSPQAKNPGQGHMLTYANILKAPKKVRSILNNGGIYNYLKTFKKINTRLSKKQIEELKSLIKAYNKQGQSKKQNISEESLSKSNQELKKYKNRMLLALKRQLKATSMNERTDAIRNLKDAAYLTNLHLQRKKEITPLPKNTFTFAKNANVKVIRKSRAKPLTENKPKIYEQFLRKYKNKKSLKGLKSYVVETNSNANTNGAAAGAIRPNTVNEIRRHTERIGLKNRNLKKNQLKEEKVKNRPSRKKARR